MLPKYLRITPRERIKDILISGITKKHPLFIIKSLPRKTGPPRFSIAIAKKIEGTNVLKNRLRRRVYDAIRLALREIPAPPPRDYVFILRTPLEKIAHTTLVTTIKNLLP